MMESSSEVRAACLVAGVHHAAKAGDNAQSELAIGLAEERWATDGL